MRSELLLVIDSGHGFLMIAHMLYGHYEPGVSTVLKGDSRITLVHSEWLRALPMSSVWFR